jgi:hypothetical protein
VAASAASVPVLEWRRDVGDERYLSDLARLVEPQDEVAEAIGRTAGEPAGDAALLPNGG